MTSARRSAGKAGSPRQALVVAGMHRSGTSAMARLLSLAGAGLPDRVIDAAPDNPLGFWEPVEMVSLSDALLTAVGSHWDDVFVHRKGREAWAGREPFLDTARTFIRQGYGDQALPVLKDPRASVLVPFWQEVLTGAGLSPVYVIMVRNPLEVARSLAARGAFPREKALLAWTSYMVAVERDTRALPRVFVTYSDMLNDWRGVLARIETAMGAPLPKRKPEAETEIGRFLSPTHRHHEIEETSGMDDVWSGVRRTYDWMLSAARDAAPSPEVMTGLEREMDAMGRLFEPVLAEMREARALTFRAGNAEIARCEARVIRERARNREVIEAGKRQNADLVARNATLVARHAAERRRTESAATAQTERVAELTARLRDAEARNAELQAQKQALFDSASWRMTRPLRAVARKLGRS